MEKQSNLQRWMHWLKNDHSAEGLEALLSDDVTFFSPVVHTPQVGKRITMAYLLAAGNTIGNDTFRYVQELDCGEHGVLEFETEMDGIHVNGVDIIEWNSDGEIVKFKVMLRPLKAVQMVHVQMGKMLETMK
jgi:hypothetical protein